MTLYNKLSEALQKAYGVGYAKGYQDGVVRVHWGKKMGVERIIKR